MSHWPMEHSERRIGFSFSFWRSEGWRGKCLQMEHTRVMMR